MAEFLRQVDIAVLLGMSKQRAHQLARSETFPPPTKRQGEREFWRKIDVSRWAKHHPVGDRRWGPRKIQSSAQGNT